jgi:hypothetical protein
LSGTVLFVDRTSVIGSATLSGGVATFSAPLGVGIRGLTAVFQAGTTELESPVLYQVTNPVAVCKLTRALQWLHFTVAVVAMAAMGWNAVAQTAGPAARNKAPTASITSPANNTSFPAGSNITITATASDSDGTVTKVDFLSGTTVIGTSTTSPYSFTMAKRSRRARTASPRAPG